MPVYDVNFYENAKKISSLRIFAKSIRGACSKSSRLEFPPELTCIFVRDPLSKERKKRYYDSGSFISPWLNAEDV